MAFSRAQMLDMVALESIVAVRNDLEEEQSADYAVEGVLRLVLSEALLGLQSEQFPNAGFHHLVVLVGLMFCVCSAHETSALHS